MSAFPTLDYTITCYDRLESRQRSCSAVSLTRGGFERLLIETFCYVISDIRYMISRDVFLAGDSGVVYLKTVAVSERLLSLLLF